MLGSLRPRTPGRILAVKLGYNPNSSSLGVDVTFLLFGLSAITLLTPVMATLLRLRRATKAATEGRGRSEPGAPEAT